MFRAFPLSIIRSYLLYIRRWYIPCRFDDNLQAGSGWNCSCILTLLGSCHQNLQKIYQCRMYSRKLLMMGKENSRNIYSFLTNKFGECASGWFY